MTRHVLSWVHLTRVQTTLFFKACIWVSCLVLEALFACHVAPALHAVEIPQMGHDARASRTAGVGWWRKRILVLCLAGLANARQPQLRQLEMPGFLVQLHQQWKLPQAGNLRSRSYRMVATACSSAVAHSLQAACSQKQRSTLAVECVPYLGLDSPRFALHVHDGEQEANGSLTPPADFAVKTMRFGHSHLASMSIDEIDEHLNPLIGQLIESMRKHRAVPQPCPRARQSSSGLYIASADGQ